VFLSRDVVAAVLVQLERQWRIQSSAEEQTSYADPPAKATSMQHALDGRLTPERALSKAA